MLEILMGINETFETQQGSQSKARLYYINSDNCVPSEITDMVFIGQKELVKAFEDLRREEMTMAEMARLGAAAILFIEKLKISDGVGVGTGKPQVWFIKYGSNPREIKDAELGSLLAGIDNKIEEISDSLHSMFRS